MSEDVVERIATLTQREREILQLIGIGLSSGEIGRRLHRSVKTVETHRRALGRKLGAHNRVELARMAIAAGLIEVPTAKNSEGSAAGKPSPRSRFHELLSNLNAQGEKLRGRQYTQALPAMLGKALGQSASVVLAQYLDEKSGRSQYGSHGDTGSEIADLPLSESPLNALAGARRSATVEDMSRPPVTVVGLRVPVTQAGVTAILAVFLRQPPDPSLDLPLVLEMLAWRCAVESASGS